MKYLIAFICLTLGGCTIPVVTLKKAEIDHLAVVEIDLEAWVSNNEFAFVSHIDGVWELELSE